MIREYLTSVTNAPRMETLWEMHCARMADYGFDRLIYGLTRYRTATSLGDPQDMVILSNHDGDYAREYLEDGHYFHAPMVRWALEHEGSCSWSLVEAMSKSETLSPAEAKVVEFNRSMGVTAGYTVSFKSVSRRSKGAVALCARKGLSQAEVDEIWAEHGDDIVLMNNVLHLKVLTLPYTTSRPLTKRQREVLEFVGDGKTTQDIAQLLGLTPATIEKHLRLAREAMDVDTTAQAVLKAAFQNQMFILDPDV